MALQGENLGDGGLPGGRTTPGSREPQNLHATLGGCCREYQFSGTFDLPCVIQNLEEEILSHGGSWKESWFGHFHVDVDLPMRHCLYKRVMRFA